jgi:peptide/nickel transport system permease protein
MWKQHPLLCRSENLGGRCGKRVTSTTPALGAAPQGTSVRLFRRWRKLRRHPLFWIGSLLLLFLLLFSFLGPVFDPHVGEHYNMALSMLPPDPAHLLGTNILGQDELAQLMVAGQQPIIAGFITAAFASLIGVLVGITAAYSGSMVDSMLMRITDMILSIPIVVPILLLESILGASMGSLVLVVALTAWPATARIIRSRTLVVRRQPYVESALSSGASHAWVLRRHIVPNVMDEIIVAATNQFANVVLIMAICTFVGLGLPPPWNWATMFSENIGSVLAGQWWLVYPPGIAFSVLLVSVYFLGEAVRHALNPRASREEA